MAEGEKAVLANPEQLALTPEQWAEDGHKPLWVRCKSFEGVHFDSEIGFGRMRICVGDIVVAEGSDLVLYAEFVFIGPYFTGGDERVYRWMR